MNDASGKPFKALFLGTGTSTGVPMIGCECEVCLSADPRNRRLRPSLYLNLGEIAVLIDASPDLREQAITHDLRQMDAVLFTHSHADHIFGLDDLRRFNTLQDNQAIPVYGAPETLSEIARIFRYLFETVNPRLYRAKLDLHSVEAPFKLARLGGGTVEEAPEVIPIDVLHGDARTLGYRINYGGRSLGYAPDCIAIQEAGIAKFKEVDVMIIDALRYRPHATHMTIDESLQVLREIAPRRAFLTHMSHDVDHEKVSADLPDGVHLAHDGLLVEL